MPPTSREIWNSAEWIRRRREHAHYAKWYSGQMLDRAEPKRDRDSGNLVRKFPLDLNLVKLGCDIHRDVSRGIPEDGSPLIVKTVIEQSGLEAAEVDKIEQIINNRIWRPSRGGAIQQEALLSMNIYGGAALKLSWEPWNTELPYRLAVRHIRNPAHINPIFDYADPWRILECYLGYEISPKLALAKYGVTVEDDGQQALYMEHWTPTTWKITVNDKVPTMKWGDDKWALQGDNPWNFVPIYYIPHERTTELLGSSQVESQIEITKDVNSRMANVSDMVRHTRPGLLVGHDLDSALKTRRIVVDGQILERVVDLGRTRNIQGAHPPGLDALPVPDLSESMTSFPSTLLDWWMMLERVSPAAFGMDDTQSGRITGPAVSQRMWSSMAHCTTERINFSTTKTIMDRHATIILAEREKAGDFEKLGIPAPGIDAVAPAIAVKQVWPPMLPMDKIEKHNELIEELQSGGISIERYLENKSVEDIEGERERIVKWQTEQAEIEAKAKPEPTNEPSSSRQS